MPEFVEAAKGRVQEFFEECPDMEVHWQFMGFGFPEREGSDILDSYVDDPYLDWGDFSSDDYDSHSE